MSHALRVGVADQIGYFRAYNTDGSAKTDLVYNTPGLSLSVFRVGAAAVSISSLSAKAADNTAHADGAIRAVSGNLYTVDLPDAGTADQVPSISVKGSYTGGVIEGPEHPLIGYNPASVAVGANTTTPPAVGAIADQVWDEARSGHTTAGTFGEKVNAELDPASIDAVQSGLATASALATTHALLQLTDTDVAAIEARLPSDPADQSAVEAAITAATSPLATSSALSTAAGNITTILGKFTGITLLARWFGILGGKTADSTTLAEFNATTGGTSYDNTTDSPEAIRDRGDAAWITGSGAGGTTTIVTLQAVAGISPGVIVGPSEPLVIGDDYLTAMNRSVRINLLDADGDPAEVDYGTYALDDVGISIQLLLARSGKPSTVADLVGTCTFFPAVDDVPPYLIVEFTKTETVKAIPGPYDMQAEAIWNDGKVVTFAPYGQIQFVRNIRRS